MISCNIKSVIYIGFLEIYVHLCRALLIYADWGSCILIRKVYGRIHTPVVSL